jgi:hypothetical protein
MDAIQHHSGDLHLLLEDLLAWSNKPTYLIPMAYQWCSAIFEKMRERGEDEPNSDGLPRIYFIDDYPLLLHQSLAVTFRHIGSDYISLPICLPHTHHHELMLDYIFAGEDDDLIADVMYVWISDQSAILPGSCTHRLLKLTERGRPFSPRLRWTIIHAVPWLWEPELEAAGLEFVHLLHHLEVGVGDVDDAEGWILLLIYVLYSPVGQEHLSSHYWLLLGDLVSMTPPLDLGSEHDKDMEIMKSLEEAQDWEKLEMWMLFIWNSEDDHRIPIPIRDIKQATLTLFQQRSSAMLRFKDLHDKCTQPSYPETLFKSCEDEFQWICNQVQTEQLCLGSPL